MAMIVAAASVASLALGGVAYLLFARAREPNPGLGLAALVLGGVGVLGLIVSAAIAAF